jgi:ABC-2 type transport system ATP-binding protein
MATDAIIETQALTKRFGQRAAVDAVDLSVPRGTCFGFLGPNGAGKTTLIRVLLGLANPTSGVAVVRGKNLATERQAALDRVGGIVEEPRFYPYMTGRQNLEAWAALLGDGARERIGPVLARVQLEARGDEKVSKYSLGMRQRLGVARALLADPEVLILDEPSNGLDPAGIVDFRLMLRGMVEQEGRTVFISSHLLDEIQRTCDHVAIVNHGKVIVQGSVRDLIESGERGIAVDSDDPGRAEGVLREIPGVTSVRRRDDGSLLALAAPTRELAMHVTRALVGAGIGVASVAPSEQSLEGRYLEMTAGSTPSALGTAAPAPAGGPLPPPNPGNRRG